MTTVSLSITDAHRLITDALVNNRTSIENAALVADALVTAEIDGQKGHGLSRVASYAAQAKSGKVDGHATPRLETAGKAAFRIDAANGFAFPALGLAREKLLEQTPETGICAASVFNSHHCGQAGFQVEKLAEHGLVGLIFANSPKAIAPWGGSAPLFGTNPIAFAAPRRSAPPLVIDLSLSKVARGKVMVAKQRGETIPDDWAIDRDGNPTTDPEDALAGSMLPMGGAKGAALVLMVEILAAAITGANFGFEASSFFEAEGAPPGVGHLLIAIDPAGLSGDGFSDRLEVLISAMLGQPGTRLPGSGKSGRRERAHQDGLSIPEALFEDLKGLCR